MQHCAISICKRVCFSRNDNRVFEGTCLQRGSPSAANSIASPWLDADVVVPDSSTFAAVGYPIGRGPPLGRGGGPEPLPSVCFSGIDPVRLPEEGREQLKLFEKVQAMDSFFAVRKVLGPSTGER